MTVHCMAVAQLEVHSHCRNKKFFMQSSNLTLGPYFTYAKNEKQLNKKLLLIIFRRFSKFSR